VRRPATGKDAAAARPPSRVDDDWPNTSTRASGSPITRTADVAPDFGSALLAPFLDLLVDPRPSDRGETSDLALRDSRVERSRYELSDRFVFATVGCLCLTQPIAVLAKLGLDALALVWHGARV
jgi:hypothetical protein